MYPILSLTSHAFSVINTYSCLLVKGEVFMNEFLGWMKENYPCDSKYIVEAHLNVS